VQKEIWSKVERKIDYEIERELGELVEWYKNFRWLYYTQLSFNYYAPPGHLPRIKPIPERFPVLCHFRELLERQLLALRNV
jgi:hypothetical protein